MEKSAPNDLTADEATRHGFPDIDEELSGSFSLSAVWRSLLKRCILALPCGIVLAAIACAAVWYVTEPQYRSAATLQISEKRPYLAFPAEVSEPGFVESQIELLRGAFIIGRAIDSEGLTQLPELREIDGKQDAIQWIIKRLKVVRIGQSELYEVSFTTREPVTAQHVVKSIVDTYMHFQTTNTDSQRQRMLELLNEEQAGRDKDIDLKRDKLREIAKQAGSGDDAMLIGGQAGAGTGGQMTFLSSLEQKLVITEIEIEVAIARVRALNNLADEPIEIPASRVAVDLRREPEIVGLTRELAEMRKSLDEASQSDAASIREAISTKQKELEVRKTELRTALTAEAETTIADQRREARRQAEAELNITREVAVRLRARLEAEHGAQSLHGDRSMELQFARDELRNAEDIRKRISDRSVRLTMESRAPSQVSLIQRPSTPDFPEESGLVEQFAVAGTIAFLTPFVLCVPCYTLAAFWRVKTRAAQRGIPG